MKCEFTGEFDLGATIGKLARKVEKANNKFVKIGYTQNNNFYYPSGRSVITVYYINKEGKDPSDPKQIPQREPYSVAAASYHSEMANDFNKSVVSYLHKGGTYPEMLKYIGDQFKTYVVATIESGVIQPPNAPFTVAKKGFDRPYYETGAFVANLGVFPSNE